MDPERRKAFAETRRREDRERLEAAIEQLTDSAGWERWVKARGRFHNYSFHNSLLIAMQCPHATQVASYRTWQSVGRQVRKGEHGIRIFAPMRIRAKGEGRTGGPSAGHGASIAQQVAARRTSITDGTHSGNDGAGETRLLFKSVSVFDVTQTDGEELPALDVEPITGETHGEYLPRLERFAGTLGFAVAYEEIPGGAQGFCRREGEEPGGQIAVQADLPANARVRVLVHELAHGLGVGYREYGRETAEVIVESAAFVVLAALGLDTSGESVPYVATWGHGSADTLREYAGKVDEIASKLERALGVRS